MHDDLLRSIVRFLPLRDARVAVEAVLGARAANTMGWWYGLFGVRPRDAAAAAAPVNYFVLWLYFGCGGRRNSVRMRAIAVQEEIDSLFAQALVLTRDITFFVRRSNVDYKMAMYRLAAAYRPLRFVGLGGEAAMAAARAHYAKHNMRTEASILPQLLARGEWWGLNPNYAVFVFEHAEGHTWSIAPSDAGQRMQVSWGGEDKAGTYEWRTETSTIASDDEKRVRIANATLASPDPACQAKMQLLDICQCTLPIVGLDVAYFNSIPKTAAVAEAEVASCMQFCILHD
jgi:hypothetical protein